MVPRLTIPEKILIHLYHYRKYSDRYEYPIEMTQQGIAESIGISVTHVPRNMKKLQDEGLVEVRKGHVSGKKKRVTVYFLTSSGIIKAKEIIKRIESQEIEIDGKYLRIGEIKKITGRNLSEIILSLEKGEEIDLLESKKIVFKEQKMEYKLFIDRESELKLMKQWYRKGKVLAIVGPRGMGKTILVCEFLKRERIREGIVWFHLYEGRKWRDIGEIMKNLFNMEGVLNILRKHPTLLVFDNYYMVDDEFVEALQSLIKEDIGKSKIIVTMPSSTPYYNRFYTLKDIEDGRIWEIQLNALNYEDARKILPQVREDAFKRIYQITKGNTKLLSLLAKGDLKYADDLPITQETVHLLNYLASIKKV
ncbi:ATPase [Euryarchaeota archaeon ex4484_178]|nr:MAG: ATPase [Euryarchaeota archaeon ex4484_178]